MKQRYKAWQVVLFIYGFGAIFWSMVNVLVHFQWAVPIWNDVISCIASFLLTVLTVYAACGKDEKKRMIVRFAGFCTAALFLLAAVGSIVQIVTEKCGIPALIGNLVSAGISVLCGLTAKEEIAWKKPKCAAIVMASVLAFVQICSTITPIFVVMGARVGYPVEGMATEQRVPFRYAMTFAGKIGKLELLEYETPLYTEDGEETGVTLQKRAWVYLPNGYYDAENADRQYDVLYLSHGATYDENHFFNGGFFFSKFQNFFDHMIEDGRMKPMIVVTPCIYTKVKEYDEQQDLNLTVIYQYELRNCIVTSVETKYRTYAGGDVSEQSLKDTRWHRMFAGYSMGGMTTNNVFYYNLDYFANFVPMSGNGGSGEPYVTAIKERFDDAYNKDDYKIAFCAGGRDGGYKGTAGLFYDLQKPEYADYFAYDNTLQNGNYAVYIGTNHRHGSEFVLEYLYVFLPELFGAE